MKTKSSRGALAALCLVTAAVLALVYAPWQPSARAADEESRVVDINPSQGKSLPAEEHGEEAVEAPQFWIGLGGMPIDSPVLRTQLQLADDVGVVVEQVVPGSPAEKAGLQKHDVLVSIDGEPITDWNTLRQTIASREDKPIKLKLMRLAKEVTVSVTPEKRPADQVASQPGQEQLQQLDLGMPEVNELLKQFGGQGGVRGLVPGRNPNFQQFDLNQMPNGVSVSVTREGDGPAKVTVKKGDETWTVEGDDAKSLEKLPEEVRPFVKQMLSGPRMGNRPNFNFGELQGVLPDQLGRFNIEEHLNTDGIREQAEKSHQQMLKRMEEMEQRLEDLRRQLDEGQPAQDQPADEAPAVNDQST